MTSTAATISALHICIVLEKGRAMIVNESFILPDHRDLKCSSSILQVSVTSHLNFFNKLLQSFRCFSRGGVMRYQKVFSGQLLNGRRCLLYTIQMFHCGVKEQQLNTEFKLLSLDFYILNVLCSFATVFVSSTGLITGHTFRLLHIQKCTSVQLLASL